MEFVGTLKVQRDQAAGKSVAARVIDQREYMHELEKFDRLVDRGHTDLGEAEQKKLMAEMQEQDRCIDAAFVKFAFG